MLQRTMNTDTFTRHILVIDDNQAIHEDFRKILSTTKTGTSKVEDFEAEFFGETSFTTKQPKFEIDSAFQGQDGLNLVRRALQENRPYPLAFVDVRMPPGWDGIETIARIWKEYPDLQVVICTAYSDYSWDDIIKKLGKDRVVLLKKPFDCAQVLELARTLTDKWQESQQARQKPDNPA
jgi:DNA-binding NtrC family response regulator